MRVLIDACLPAQFKARLGLAGAASSRVVMWRGAVESRLDHAGNL